MKNFSFVYRNGKYSIKFKNKQVPNNIHLFLKIKKEHFEQIIQNLNGDITLTKDIVFYSKDEANKFIDFLNKKF